ncbi:hypothetical protein Anas_11313 [Armadillidium nasatum]|uniref:Tuftelin interacting protein N-terminal domain-containing protein n=1 Tax=Armadillidium nasatum TaxID=96803 RepID=A0A5N5T5E4_9CRUS|nr:hypothetical protein Anas_11313 [Armadillidium nasatum]
MGFIIRDSPPVFITKLVGNTTNEVEEIASQPFSQAKLLQKGLNFVAGGIQQAGKKKDKKVDEKDEDDDDKEYHPKPIFSSHQIDSSDEEDNLPLDFGSRKKNLGSKNLNERNDARELAGFRNHRGGAHFREGGIADWEKHTTGIGK